MLLKGISAKVEDLAPSTGQVSGGFCAGFVSGYALKKIGKGVSFLVGLGFIGEPSPIWVTGEERSDARRSTLGQREFRA